MTRHEETTTVKKDTTPKLGKIIQIDEERIHDHLGDMVRGSVEETLSALLDAEADRICQATRYERSRKRRHPRRALSAQAAYQGRRGDAQHAEAPQTAL